MGFAALNPSYDGFPPCNMIDLKLAPSHQEIIAQTDWHGAQANRPRGKAVPTPCHPIAPARAGTTPSRRNRYDFFMSRSAMSLAMSASSFATTLAKSDADR